MSLLAFEPAASYLVRQRGKLDRLLRSSALVTEGWPRRWVRRPEVQERAPVLRFATLLAEMGPVYLRFGRYLASRGDLLDTAETTILRAAIPDWAPPTDSAAMAGHVARQLSVPLEEVFAGVEPEPCRSTLLNQAHEARLRTGESVVIEAVRPGIIEFLEEDLTLLAHLLERLDGQYWDLQSEDLEEFQSLLTAEFDFDQRASDVELLRQQTSSSGLRVPAVFDTWSGPYLLVSERLSGVAVSSLFPQLEALAGQEIEGVEAKRRAEFAVRLVVLWLQLSLGGHPFPTHFDPSCLLVLDDGQLAFLGGALVTLPSSARDPLLRYLVATDEQDPDGALAALLEVAPTAPAAAAERLLKRWRQMVPLRDGGPGAASDLGGLLGLQGRMAREEGCHPPAHVLAFQSGLEELAALTRPLVEFGDPLREGLGRVQLSNGFAKFRQNFASHQLTHQAEQALHMMAALPDRLDRLLNMAAEGQFAVHLQFDEPTSAAQRRGRFYAAVGLLLAMGGVALLADFFQAVLTPPWGDRLAVILLALLGWRLFEQMGGPR